MHNMELVQQCHISVIATYVAVSVAVGLVEGANGHEAGVLSARAGVGLQRHLVEARDLRQLPRQVLWRSGGA